MKKLNEKENFNSRIISNNSTIIEKLKDEIKFRLKVERIFGDISTYLVFSIDFDKAIDYFLSELAILYHEFMVDSFVVFLFDEPVNDEIMILGWNSERALSHKKDFTKFPIQDLPWLKQELLDGREVIFDRASNSLKDTMKEKRFFEKFGIESLIGLPIFTPEYLAGALIIINLTKFYNWQEQEIRTLRIFADILGTSIYRRKTAETLSKSRDYLKEQVSRKTKDLLAEKKRIELILNTIKDGVVVLDIEGKTTIINDTAKNFFSKILQKEIPEGSNLVLSHGHPIFDTIRDLFMSHESKEITIKPMKGMYLQFVSGGRKFPMINPFETIIEFRDVTRFIEFENMRKRFISTVSHELRTPITVINQSISNFERYQKRLPEETQTKLISSISRNAQLLHELIEDLLLVSRIDERKLKFNWQEYSPNQVLADVLDQLEPRRKLKNIKISTSINDDFELIGDPKRIAQIFRIILDNSLKYSSDGDSIFIEASDSYSGPYNPQKMKGILMKFSDTGIGIHEEDLPKLFNRFFRSTLVNHVSGSGLGLGIAKELIKLHDGDIFVKSKLGEGTTVFLYIPKLSKQKIEQLKDMI